MFLRYDLKLPLEKAKDVSIQERSQRFTWDPQQNNIQFILTLTSSMNQHPTNPNNQKQG